MLLTTRHPMILTPKVSAVMQSRVSFAQRPFPFHPTLLLRLLVVPIRILSPIHSQVCHPFTLLYLFYETGTVLLAC